MSRPLRLRDRIASVSDSLSPAQRRVARLVDASPDVVAFGTVAEVADASETSPQTVLRLAARLGHAGFPDLQAEVRTELVARLPPAADRIRRPPSGDLPADVEAADARNVSASLDIEPSTLAGVVEVLSSATQVAVIVAESWTGVGHLLVDHLAQLRERVDLVSGPPTRVARQLAHLGPGDVVVAIDVRRYERWMLDAVAQAASGSVAIIGISDGPTSPLLARADHRLVVGVSSPGPFESATGVVALMHLLTTGVAAARREASRTRLDEAESAWAATDSLVDDDG